MLNKISIIAAYLFIISINLGKCETNAGLIVSGLDTLNSPREWGFDFLLDSACITDYSSGRYNCFSHFNIVYLEAPLRYELGVAPLGYGIKMGLINLDSIINAPHDSVFQNYGNWIHVDSIPPDSLSTRIGMCYVIKTGRDPRRGYPYYAKIRILDFIIHNAETHEVDMIFLWAVQKDGTGRLETSGIDTFDLPTTLAYFPENSLSPAPRTVAGRGVGFTARRVVVPEYGVVVKRGNGVFDLRGRKVYNYTK